MKIRYFVFTHAHFDHIGAYHKVKERFPEAKLIIGKKEEEVLSDKEKSMLRLSGEKKEITADIFLSENDLIEFGDHALKVIETPGHTVGSICLYGEGVLFSGDTLFSGGMGRWDFPTGDYEDEKNSILNKIFTLPDETAVYPGHGEKTTVADEKYGGLL